MDLLTRFAGNVRRLRAKKKLSQKALADKVGISVSYVSMLSAGSARHRWRPSRRWRRRWVPPANLLGK